MTTMAEGCCSSITPCNHQRDFPWTICDVCRIAQLQAEVALWKDRYESLLRDARSSERNFDEFMRRAGWDT